jgi:hypothetical protein
MNRKARRHPEESTTKPPHDKDLVKADRPPDVTDPRAKNSGHGKKTADKWNQ